MASLSRLIKEKGLEPGGIRTDQVKVQQIHYTKLRESGLNFYTRSGEEVMELADTMLITGGILQPLIVRKTDLGEYEILAGHKRKRASVYNVQRGYREYEFLPCIVVDMGGLMAKKISEKILAGQGDAGDDRLLDMIAEYIVICTNSTAGESSSYEKMMQAVRLSEIIPVMLENGELKGRALRAEIAKEMKCGDGQVGRYQSIYKNLVPEAMERFKDGRISFSVACGLSGLDSGRQQQALKKQQVTMADIDELKQEKNRETVSSLDTGKAPSGVKTADGGEYSFTETTENGIQYALELIFDRDDSGFPRDVMRELLETAGSSGNVSLLADIMKRALPFENKYIKFEQACGYYIYFKQDRQKTGMALWPFWRGFMERYHYNRPSDSGLQAAVTDGGQDAAADVAQEFQGNVPAAGMGGDTAEDSAGGDLQDGQADSAGYTQEDVRNIYEEQVRRIKICERERELGRATDSDEWQYKKARIIRDGMTYILKAFKEGTIC